jgi:hypothetical protein
MAENYLSTLKQRVQKKGENLLDLADDIQQLSLQAYPEAPYNFLERLTIGHFKDAVSDADVRSAIHRNNPKTLDGAVNAALDAENWLKIEKDRKGITAIRQVGQNSTNAIAPEYITKMEMTKILEKQQATLKAMMGDIMIKKDSSSSRRKPLKCWSCNQLGHRADQCHQNGQRPHPNGPRPHPNQWSQPQMGPVPQNLNVAPQVHPPPPQAPLNMGPPVRQ